MDQYIDLIIPRGGRALIETVVSYARMPVIKHYVGVCVAYVDREADLDMAVRIVINAKTQRPGVCKRYRNGARASGNRSLLFQKDRADTGGKESGNAGRSRQLPSALSSQLPSTPPCPRRRLDHGISRSHPRYPDVDNIENAIAHVERCGSHHSDVIITRDAARAEKFLNEVDSATVYWNASTRFTDGAEFGFGAEIGISTDKLHARGPMALEELMTYKYVIRGQGQIRE